MNPNAATLVVKTRPPRWAYAVWLAGIGLVLAAGLTQSGCAEETPGGLRYIEGDQVNIQNPGGPHSAATGVGCAETEREALTQARSTAQYNLRTVLGAGNYKVDFRILREVPGNKRFCVEVEARVTR